MAKKVLVKIHLLIKVNTEKTPTNRLCAFFLYDTVHSIRF